MSNNSITKKTFKSSFIRITQAYASRAFFCIFRATVARLGGHFVHFLADPRAVGPIQLPFS